MSNGDSSTRLSVTEIYRQAHETRRKWENYIWQWSIVLTILAVVFVQFSPTLLEPNTSSEPTSKPSTVSGSASEPVDISEPATETAATSEFNLSFSLPQKIILSLIALFVISIFLNVYRARVLMKELEKSISSMHKKIKFNVPIVPLELDKPLPYFKKISSTQLSIICHFIAVLVFLSIAIYAWCI